MKGILRLVIKGVVYIVIVWPLVGLITGAIFGDVAGGFIGFIAAAGLAFWLETSGKSNQILNNVFSGGASSSGSTGGADAASLFQSGPTGVETTMVCPQCGAMVTLYDGHGKCEACDNAY